MIYDMDKGPDDPVLRHTWKRARYMHHYGRGDQDLREFLIDLNRAERQRTDEPKRSFWRRFLEYLTKPKVRIEP